MKLKIFSSHSLVALCLLCLAACGSQEPRAVANQPTSAVDLSGFWELNYSQSDNIQARLNTLVRELRKRSGPPSGPYQQPGMIVSGPGGTNSGASIIGLAQMADLITQSQLLEVEQDKHSIKVKRELDFALTCEFYPGEYQTVETPLGKEICGWSGHQLIFKTLLPEGLIIQHVLTVGPDRQWLNVATTVTSDRVTSPFTVNRVYQRYEPQDNGYTCKMTISRGRVCTTEAQ